MQKKRPRRTGRQSAPEGGPERPPVGRGRPTHVRNRLIVAVAVVAAAVAGAGAPSVLAASGRLKDSQDLVTLAEQTQQALVLAHALADERDDVTSYVAAGRPKSKAPDEQRSARVDRQVEELRADPDTPDSLRAELDGIATVRRAALTGRSSALDAHRTYSATIAELHRLAEQLADRMPPRAGAGAHAQAELDSAVQQAAAARGLLVAALNVPTRTRTVYDPVTGLSDTVTDSSDADAKKRDALTAAAQQARLRSDADLAGFRETAPKQSTTAYDSTVTGPEVDTADRYLASLTDRPTLDDGELDTSAKKVDAALTARLDLMRGAESALYDHRVKDLERLRDDDVTALEIRIAALGALVLLTVGIATAMARSLTRPLAALRLGSGRLAQAAEPATEEPVRFTGRNDEFAEVVRSVNTLHATAVALGERVGTLEADRRHLVGERQKTADAREELRAELADSAAQLERLRATIGSTFVNLALRTLGLVERQLAVIEGLEEREHDPDRLATLFKLDHFATVMRRHSENLLVLAGTEHVQQHPGPVPLVDVVRAAVSEIERYERVRIAALPPHAHVAGFAADDLSHLLAELMENATAFSPPDLPVEVSGWLLENGEVMLSVQDEGIGLPEERLGRLNARLADFDPEVPYDQEGGEGLGLGLYVVARLAHRLGVRVRLREQKQGGLAAVVVLPTVLLAGTAAPPSTAHADGTTGAFSLPGADAEANSNVLHGRTADGDPLVALAERTVREQGAQTPTGAAPEAEGAQPPEPATPAHPADPAAHAAHPADAADDAAARTRDEGDSSRTAHAASDAGHGPARPDDGASDPAGAADAAGSAAAPGEFDAPDALRRPTAPGAPEAPRDPAATEAAARPAGPDATGSPATSAAPAASGVPAGDGHPESPAETTMELLIPAPRTRHPDRQDAEAERTADPRQPAPRAEGAWSPPAETAPPTDPAVPPAETAPSADPAVPPADPATRGEHPAHSDDGSPAHTRGEDPARTGGQHTAHHRPASERDTEPAPPGGPAPGAGGTGAEPEERLTDKGLPKRTPKITAPAEAPRRRSGSVDADALRRRLGGFRSGAQAGYRAAEAEIAEQTGRNRAPAADPATRPAHVDQPTGGTVEEASS
ncbi:nitrate- and nitrite sensing domain-containing protein [Streptomyces sp. MS06]|uniref:sensor histidine kinase n=1 Tax=Streptomyces sp. MS06 TaxID=3385974 RepID=UPI00399F4B6D